MGFIYKKEGRTAGHDGVDDWRWPDRDGPCSYYTAVRYWHCTIARIRGPYPVLLYSTSNLNKAKTLPCGQHENKFDLSLCDLSFNTSTGLEFSNDLNDILNGYLFDGGSINNIINFDSSSNKSRRARRNDEFIHAGY